MIVENAFENQISRQPGATARLTLFDPSRRPEDHKGPQRPKAMRRT